MRRFAQVDERHEALVRPERLLEPALAVEALEGVARRAPEELHGEGSSGERARKTSPAPPRPRGPSIV